MMTEPLFWLSAEKAIVQDRSTAVPTREKTNLGVCINLCNINTREYLKVHH